MKKSNLLLSLFYSLLIPFFILSIPSAFAVTTSVRVTSSPSGARIIINDLEQNRLTPATIKHLEEGKKYKFRLVKKGYKNFETGLKIESGTNEVHGDLEKEVKKEQKSDSKENKKESERNKDKAQVDESNGSKVERAFGYNKMYKEGTYGWLEVSTFPNGAVVYINEERQVGTTPNKYKTPIGTFKVSVVIKGKAVREFEKVKIRPGETTTLEPIDFRDEVQRPNTKPLLH